jgi:hypothetical protein
MSKEKELIEALMGAVGDETEISDEPEPETAFGLALSAALGSAVAYMRGEGVIEMEDHHVEGLVMELKEVGLDARSPKQMMRRLSRTLVESDHVEEVFGSDDDISAAVQRFLAPPR